MTTTTPTAATSEDFDMHPDTPPELTPATGQSHPTVDDLDLDLPDPDLAPDLAQDFDSDDGGRGVGFDTGFDLEDAGERSSEALFDGDDGRLDLDQRRTLVAIIKKRFISGVSDPRAWKTLVEHQQLLRSRLNDLFMDLHLDLEREIAFKRQVSPEGGGTFPTLLYDTPWGREDTILLVHLRSQMRKEQAAGNTHVYVDRNDMLEAIESHRPTSATDHAADLRRAMKSIETLYKAGLLIGPSTGDRFEVSPAIEVILPVEKLRELLTWLRTENGTTEPIIEPATGTDQAIDPNQEPR